MPEEKEMPSNPIAFINLLLDNGLVGQAEEKIKEWKLKIKIENGKIVDISNTTDAWLRKLITVDSRMMQLKDEVRKLAKEPYEVTIFGPTGTGKEIIARALHDDKEGRFIAINCAGLPENLLESELFGHVQGAFTGAIRTKPGLFSLANGGTLFLDEIGELPIDLQAKLLRALQEKIIRKVGGDKDEDVKDCRVICATHKNLWTLVAENKFRIDLFARITTFVLKTYGLDERPNDVIPIIESLDGGKEFLEAWNKKPHIAGTPIKLDTSLNVRSLQQHVLRYKVLGKLPQF